MKTVSVFSQIRNLTGLSIHADTWLESHGERLTLERQTREIAAKLASSGYDPFRQVNGNEFSIVGMVTGKVEVVPPYRNVNILPSVSSANRCQQLKQMDFWSEGRNHLRYAVVTNGRRCPLAELRARMQSLSRAISNFACHPELRALGVTVVFRGLETTVRREVFGEDEGKITCHPHANVVFDFSRRLTPEDFQAFLKLGHREFPGHWRDCGRLVKSREVLKYPTKPVEVSALTGEELVDLANAMQGLKLAQPMGDFLVFRRELKDEGLKLGKRMEQGEWEWCKVMRRGGTPHDEPHDDLREVIEEINDRETKPPNNQCLAVLAPSPRFEPRFEPCLLVLNYGGNLTQTIAQAQLDDIAADARALWEAARIESAALTSTPPRQLLSEVSDELSPPAFSEDTMPESRSWHPACCTPLPVKSESASSSTPSSPGLAERPRVACRPSPPPAPASPSPDPQQFSSP